MCNLGLVRNKVFNIPENKPKIGYRWFMFRLTKKDKKIILMPIYYCNKRTWHNKVAKCDLSIEEYNDSGLHIFESKSKALNDSPYDCDYNCLLGKVKFWGKCIEHEHGFRAEYAQILELYSTKKWWEPIEIEKDFKVLFKKNKNLKHIKLL